MTLPANRRAQQTPFRAATLRVKDALTSLGSISVAAGRKMFRIFKAESQWGELNQTE